MKVRIILVAFSLALLTMLSFGIQAQERAATQQKDDIISSEQELARRFADFQDALLKLKQRLARGDAQERKRAEVLDKILEECRTLAINQEFTKMIELLRTLDYKSTDPLDRAERQSDVLTSKIRRVLDMLQNSKLDHSEARRQLQKILEDLDRAITTQRQVQAQTEIGRTDSKELAKNQQDATKKAENVAKDIDKMLNKDGKGQGGEAADLKGKSKEGKGEGAKGEAKNAGESKNANENPRGEARNDPKNPKGGEGKGEAKPSDSKGNQGAKGEGEPKSGAKPGGGEQKGKDAPMSGAKPGDKGAKGGEGAAKENKGDKTAKGNEGGAKDAGDKKGDPKGGEQGAAKPGGGEKKQGGDSKPDSGAKPGGGEAGGGGEPKVGGPKTPDGGDAKGGDAKGGDAKGGDGGGQGDAKSGDSKDGQGAAKDGGGSGGGGGGGSPPPGGSAKDSPPPGGGGQPPPPGGNQDQDVANAGKKIQEAGYDQKIAEEKIPQKNNEAAAKAQADAIKKMEEAKKKLEQLLRQMREEEIERVLAALQARCEKMYIMQLEVLAGTEEVEKIVQSNADKKPTQANKNESLKLSDKEKEIVKEADKCIDILESEGTAVAFPEVFQQLRADMKHVQNRLGIFDTGTVTQDIERDIVATLKEMIEALKKAREENQEPPDSKPGKGGKGGKPGDQKLLELLQELKMVRSLQKRINDRTVDRGRQYQGEQANDPQVVRELRALAERQLRIQEIVANIAKGAQK